MRGERRACHSTDNGVQRYLGLVAADAIDAGDHPDLQFVVAVLVDRVRGTGLPAFVTYAWGEASALESIGALVRAGTCGLVDE